jgi:hypothetical protein
LMGKRAGFTFKTSSGEQTFIHATSFVHDIKSAFP